jgi:hypothetical protein
METLNLGNRSSILIHICECPNWDSTKGLCPYSEPGVQFRVTSVLICRSVA